MSEHPEPLEQEQLNEYRYHVASCSFFPQDRADFTYTVHELCQRMSNLYRAEFVEIEEACQVLES